jgi:hypothetical protein
VADDEFEYTEPTNEQLARFLVVSAKSDPRMEGLDLGPGAGLGDQSPAQRGEAAVRAYSPKR